MAKTAVGGEDREPEDNGNEYPPKPALDDAAHRRAQEFIEAHFNDRRGKHPAADPHPYIGDGKTSSKSWDKTPYTPSPADYKYKPKRKNEPSPEEWKPNRVMPDPKDYGDYKKKWKKD